MSKRLKGVGFQPARVATRPVVATKAPASDPNKRAVSPEDLAHLRGLNQRVAQAKIAMADAVLAQFQAEEQVGRAAEAVRKVSAELQAAAEASAKGFGLLTGDSKEQWTFKLDSGEWVRVA